MTPDEINQAVARKLGWKRIKTDLFDDAWVNGTVEIDAKCGWAEYNFKWATSIEAAWEIVEFMAKTQFPKVMYVYKEIDTEGMWGCRLGVGLDGDTWADTAPMAICLAFLKLEDK
jgi:hypothetical protein